MTKAKTNPDEVETFVAEEVHEISDTPQQVLELANISQYVQIKTRAHQILKEYGFSEMIRKIEDYEKELDSIVIKDEFDFENMERCGAIRKALVKIRTGSKSTHDAIKESAKIEGKFIDGLHNVVDSKETVVEKKATEKEEHGIRIAQERANKRFKERSEELNSYEYNWQGLDLANMPDDVYAAKVRDAKDTQEAKKLLFDKRKKEEDEEFQKQQLEQAQKELQDKRLRYLNGLGLIYSDENLGTITEDEFQTVVTQLKLNKKEAEEANEKLKQDQKLLEDQLEKQRVANQKIVDDLKKQNEENQKQIDAKNLQLKEQEKNTISIPVFTTPKQTTTVKKKNLQESRAIRLMVEDVTKMTRLEKEINDHELKRLYVLYRDAIIETSNKLLLTLQKYDKG